MLEINKVLLSVLKKNIDEYSSLLCANGDTCIDLSDGNYTLNYISSNCSIFISESCFVRLYSCQNNGTWIWKSRTRCVDNPK